MTNRTGLLVALSLALIAPFSHAQALDPQIQDLLGKVAAAYRDMNAFSATIETVQTSGAASRSSTVKLSLEKPGKLSAEIANGSVITRVVADGTKAYSDRSLDKTTYTQIPANDLSQAVNAVVRSGGAGVGLLPILLTSPDASKQIIPGSPATLTRQPDATFDGVVCDVILAEVGTAEQGRRIEFAFGKQDHLLRRLTMGPRSDPKPLVVETYTNVNASPTFAPDQFTYTPAPGAIAVDAPKQQEMFDPRIKVNANPLAITGKDLSGQPVSLDQYKGKVVLVDFWAIWCGPCIAELPNVVAAYDKYKDQGFDVLGISLDQPNSEAKLKTFIADNKMPWRQVYDGGYWEAANAVAWGVKAIPFTVLIGKDGKIAAVNLRGEALGPAIEAALQGRPNAEHGN